MNQQDPSKTLEWIREYMDANRYAPSRREIKEGCRISSTSVVGTHLNKLQAAGCLQWTPDVARSIVLLNGHNGRYEEPLIAWRTEVMGDPPDPGMAGAEYQQITIGEWNCVVYPLPDGRWQGYVELGSSGYVLDEDEADSELEAKKLALRLLISYLKEWLESAESAEAALQVI